MVSGKVLNILCAMLYFIGCKGLELTLDRDPTVMIRGRSACGILLCEEDIQNLDNSNSSADSSTTNMVHKSIASQSKIIELTVYERQKTSSGENNLQKERSLASVTLQQPTVFQVSNGIKVDGELDSARAFLRLEFVKQDDCDADFTCRLRVMDIHGGEHVTSSHLLQQSKECERQDDQGTMDPASAMQLLSLVEEMDKKLTCLSNSAASWDTKIDLLENRLEDKIASIENRLESRMDALENRIEDKVGSIVRSFEDKTENLEKILDDKVHKCNGINSKIDSFQREVAQDFEIVKQELKDREAKSFFKIEEINSGLEDTLNISTTLLHLIASALPALRNVCDTAFKPAEINRSIIINDFTQIFYDKLVSFSDNLQTKLQQYLEIKLDRSYEKTEIAISKFTSGINTNITADISSMIKDTLKLKSCKKSAVSIIAQPSFSYPAVYPNDESTVDVPYLCDTFTEGGGWIIIQRRSTGNVDFFRNWEAYKDGFGFLEDDFWLGNENIHKLTTAGVYELRVDMRYKGKTYFAHYSTFSLSDEMNNYALNLGSYDGTAGDSLSPHNGQSFSTFDTDNDSHRSDCANVYSGAWWYNACHTSNLNGQWAGLNYKGPSWSALTNGEPVSFSEMKIRRVDDSP